MFVLTTVVQGALTAETVRLRRGLVVPIRFQDQLSLRENRRGDRFTAVVENDRDLPYRTTLEGQVVEVHRAQDKRPGYMDLEFDTLSLPDGSRHRIEAVPIRMDDKSIRRGSDGRFTAKKKLEDSGKYVVGGMIGGYLIGRILGDKHAEGIMLGALAGVLMAETERNSTANEIVIKRDAKMGALIERDLTLEIDERNYERRDSRDGGRYEDRRDDRYNPFDPRNRQPERNRPEDRRLEEPRGLVVEYDGRELRFEGDDRPYREGDVWMVPLLQTARQIGMTVDDENSRRIYVEDDDTVLILEQDSRNYRLNGKRAELPQAVTVRDDVVYVPIDAILAAKNGQIRIIGTQPR
jgi:hypothetical protein